MDGQINALQISHEQNEGSMKFLRDLPFVDLYICLSGTAHSARAHYKPKRSDFSPTEDYSLPDEYNADLQKLTGHVRAFLDETDDASIAYDGMRLRASLIETASNEVWVAMRRNPSKPPALDALQIDPRLVGHLRSLGRRDGLILIAGATGHGKTTTACALLQDYLRRHGNIAFTIEDPVEFALDGKYKGSGHCFQVEAKDDTDWARLLKKSLRWQPQYIFVGEVRTAEAAAQILRAATSGHLIITTIHGGSVEEGLEGLLQLAESAVGPRAGQLLAAGLTAVMHQQLLPDQMRTRFYITEEGNLGDPVRGHIRAGQIGQIATYIDKQMARVGGQPLSDLPPGLARR